MNLISKARRYVDKYGGVSGAAARLGMKRSALRWLLEKPAAKRQETTPRITPVTKQLGCWMQSLHHESAHFITDGHAACEGGPKGAKIVPGMSWFPHDGCVRKCMRCMNKEGR
jgi:hypothetical protein